MLKLIQRIEKFLGIEIEISWFPLCVRAVGDYLWEITVEVPTHSITFISDSDDKQAIAERFATEVMHEACDAWGISPLYTYAERQEAAWLAGKMQADPEFREYLHAYFKRGG